MIAVATLLIILTLSLLIIRIASVALTLTGMPTEAAKFQARSAFTGTGFTTKESEMVVSHPVRRKIVTLLMVVRNAGFITAVSSLILSFAGLDDKEQGLHRLLIILTGVSVLLMLSYSHIVNQALNKIIEKCLKNWTDLDVRDFSRLLHFQDDFQVIELQVEENDWLAGKALQQLNLTAEGVLVLGVQRFEGEFIGAPTGKCRLYPEDVVLLYGKKDVLSDLDNRPKTKRGTQAHIKAKQKHQKEKRRTEKIEK